jgi:hypothetical protein
MRVSVIEKDKRDKGSLELGSNILNIKLKKEIIKIPFDKITFFEDSLTTIIEDEFLIGLSFRVKFGARNLVITFLNKKETEDGFTEFVKNIRGKLKKKKEIDYNNYLGSYYTNIPNAARIIIVIFGLIIFGISSLGFKKDVSGTIVGGVLFLIFLFIAIISKRREIITVTKNKITRHFLFREDKTVKYTQITKFTKKTNNYGSNAGVTYALYCGNKKISFEYGVIENVNKLIKFLKHKLKTVPQTDISNKKETDWPVNRTY